MRIPTKCDGGHALLVAQVSTVVAACDVVAVSTMAEVSRMFLVQVLHVSASKFAVEIVCLVGSDSAALRLDTLWPTEALKQAWNLIPMVGTCLRGHPSVQILKNTR